MIEFPCRCGHRFSVAEDMAAGSVQCPRCGRLNDVPALSDLDSINPDGTFKDIPLAPADEPDRAQKLDRAFRPSRVDQTGQEIDLRPTIDEVRQAGVEFKRPQANAPHDAPKYDPETGELIDPMKFAPEAPAKAIPVGEAPALNYARGQTDIAETVPAARVPLALLMPANISVMVIVYVAHMLLNGVAFTTFSGLFFISFGAAFLVIAILAHFGNVVDDIGRCDHDELPGLLRHASWRDDVWMPFSGFVGASILCFWPAGLAAGLKAGPGPIIALALLGSVFFPIVLMTAVCSETTRNLRPDRVVGAMAACGGVYWLMVPLGIVAMATYLIGAAGTGLHLASMGAFARDVREVLKLPPEAYYALLLAGLYLMHLFCWYVGLMYRHFNEQFPWVLQRHVYTRSLERVGRLPENTRRDAR